MSTNNYLDRKSCACIAMDLVNSEDYKDKSVVEKRLYSLSRIINKKNKEELLVPFNVRRGDEVIGVVSSFSVAIEIFDYVRRFCFHHDIKLKYGLGLGKLDTGETKDLDLINGSAVIKAFRALEMIEKKEKLTQYEDGVDFCVYAQEGIPYAAINSLVYMIYNRYNGHSEKQREAIRLTETYPWHTQEKIGIALGYEKNQKENVNKLLARADYDTYKLLKKNLKDFLEDLQSMIDKGGLLDE